MQEKPEGYAPWPETKEELLAYIDEMEQWPSGASEDSEAYGRCVYAMSNAALAAFYYMSRRLGVTGFQASAAGLQFLADSRGMKHGFILLDGENLLYPQYDLIEDAQKWADQTMRRLAPEAKKRLEEAGYAHPDARAHWERIAALPPLPEDKS